MKIAARVKGMVNIRPGRGIPTAAGLAIILLFAAALPACRNGKSPAGPGVAYSEEREPCRRFNPLRNLYFGDLHAHTSLSYDAWLWGSRALPGDAYDFARGGQTALPPFDANGNGTRPLRLGRPLDFVALTDHSEFLAETEACITPGTVVYESGSCRSIRDQNDLSMLIFSNAIFDETPERFPDVCGPGGIDCLARSAGVWDGIQAAAEAAYDRSPSCSFTSFVAFEYTNTSGISNLHRNAVFRNARVPARPISYFEQVTTTGFLSALKHDCQDSLPGCEVMLIPHNSNLSNGKIFRVDDPGAADAAGERELAALQGEMQPLAEIFQHKGESECTNVPPGTAGPADDLCGFENVHWFGPEDCGVGTGSGGMMGQGCVARRDFLRDVLLLGLQEEERLGTNPFKLGMIASTDTHNAVPGAVAEADYEGHTGWNEDTIQKRLTLISYGPLMVMSNPGGLTGVWAEENSRDAIFNALKRREVFATSGPRISVRFFGGWGYPPAMCEEDDLAGTGYQGGVPMGGDLPPRPEGAAGPVFGILAERDAGTGEGEGTALQRIQVIKGWLESPTRPAYRVFEVAGDPGNGASVDLETCETRGGGFDRLCTVWADPDFSPDQRAFYYVRVIENPTCRWSTRQCNALPSTGRPDTCVNPLVPKTIQERAWTSPIWYRPES